MAAQETTRTLSRGQTPIDVQAVRRSVCEAITAACAAAYGNRLRAIVLTGSLARNEATIVQDGERWEVLSDADCLLICFDRGRQPSAKELAEMAARIEGRLRQNGIVIHISLCAVEPFYLQSLPATSFTYELRACGEVIWGDRSILELVPNYGRSELLLEDAWRTLNNRIVELLACFEAVSLPIEQLGAAIEYATVKLYLDMATSYLIFMGRYQPTYAGRAQELSELAETGLASPVPLTNFVQRVSQATKRKISGQQWDGTNWKSVEEAMRCAHLLWNWELVRLTGAKDDAAPSALIARAARSQSFKTRARGWLSLLRRTGFSHWQHWLHWAKLSRRGTPRYLVYGVAMDLLSRLPLLVQQRGEPGALDVNWKELGAQVPERSPNSNQASDWQRVIADIRWNYETFLIGTQA